MKASDLFVRCLENEGVEYIFGIPGEENLDVMDSMIDSEIKFITTRHEQGAAFMADVYGRLTGKAGVCLATLGPGAIAAKLAYPDRTALTVTGDAGFLMNSQELETALRIGVAIVILVWNDSKYGLIKWHQDRRFGRDTQIEFNNPDLVKYAESFGAKGYRVEAADDLLPTLQQAIADDTVVLIDCPVDYSENMKLTEKLGNLVCPI
jgi:thiamine pyrophosphate-dependent acetolactate synthase large subunit-like protein